MANDLDEFVTDLGKEITQLSNLIQAVEAVTVRVEQTVLAQGKEGQLPFDETPPDKETPNPSAGKGRSENSPTDQAPNRQEPNVSEG